MAPQRQDHISGATQEAAAFVAEARQRPLPDEVATKTAYHVLDTIAAMVSGSTLAPGRRGIAYARAQGGVQEAQVAGSQVVTNAPLAAFANGMSAHADETDDSHAPSFSHPGCGVVPAALAVAERHGRSGSELIRAVSTGYDIGTRIPPALGLERSTHSNSLSSHAIVSLYGATAAAAVLEGLSEEQVRWALSYAAQETSGVTPWLRDEHHVQKAFVFAGMGARNGVFAATMVAHGFDGVGDIFSGHPNALDSLSANPDPWMMSDGLGERWEVMRTNIKKYAVGSPAQAAVQAVEELIERDAVSADDVEAVEIALPADLAGIVDRRHMADINCQYLVAGTLLDGGFSFEMAHDQARMTDPATEVLLSKITLVPDDALRGTRGGRVVIRRGSGERLESRVESVRGTVADPMSEEEVVAKAHDLLRQHLSEDESRDLIRRLLDYQAIDDVRDLRPLLAGHAKES